MENISHLFKLTWNKFFCSEEINATTLASPEHIWSHAMSEFLLNIYDSNIILGKQLTIEFLIAGMPVRPFFGMIFDFGFFFFNFIPFW